MSIIKIYNNNINNTILECYKYVNDDMLLIGKIQCSLTPPLYNWRGHHLYPERIHIITHNISINAYYHLKLINK